MKGKSKKRNESVRGNKVARKEVNVEAEHS